MHPNSKVKTSIFKYIIMINERCPEAFISPQMSFHSVSFPLSPPIDTQQHKYISHTFHLTFIRTFMSFVIISLIWCHELRAKCNFFYSTTLVQKLHNSYKLEEDRTNEFNYAFHYIANYTVFLYTQHLCIYHYMINNNKKKYFHRDLSSFILKL